MFKKNNLKKEVVLLFAAIALIIVVLVCRDSMRSKEVDVLFYDGRISVEGEAESYLNTAATKMSDEDYKYLLDIYKKRFSKPFLYSENLRYGFAEKVEDKYHEDGKEKHIYSEYKTPNEYVKFIKKHSDSFISREGYLNFNDKSFEQYSKVMSNPSTELYYEMGLPGELVSETFVKDGLKKIISENKEGKKIGYDGKGITDYEIFEKILFMSYGENLFKDMKESGYLVEGYNYDRDKYLILDNRKLLNFMDRVFIHFNNNQDNMNSLVETMKVYGFDLSDKLGEHYMSLTCIPTDYRLTVNNIFANYIRFIAMNNYHKDKNVNIRKNYNFSREIEKRFGDTFIENKRVVQVFIQENDELRQIDDLDLYTDYVFKIKSSYFLDIDNNKDYFDSLVEESKSVNDSKIEAQGCSVFDEYSSLIKTNPIQYSLDVLNNEFTKRDIESNLKRRKFDKMITKKFDETLPINKEETEIDFSKVEKIGLTGSNLNNRKNTLDSIAYWINQEFYYYNQIQNKSVIDESQEEFVNILSEVKGGEKFKAPIFRMLMPQPYFLNNIIDKTIVNKLNNLEEEITKENEQAVGEDKPAVEENKPVIEENKEFTKYLEKGLFKHLTEGDGYYEVLKSSFKKNISDWQLTRVDNNEKDSVKNLTDGKRNTILIFGEYFCPYCKDTIKVFSENIDKFKDYNLFVVSSKNSETEYRKLMEETPEIKDILNQGLFTDEVYKDELGIVYVPTLVILNKNNEIVSVNYGLNKDDLIDEFLKRNNQIFGEL